MFCILLLIPHAAVSLTFSYPWNLYEYVWCSALLDHFGVQHGVMALDVEHSAIK